jgi:hypothetical protein
MVRDKCKSLVEALKHIGPERSVDIDNAGMRYALDIVALVGPIIIEFLRHYYNNCC